MMPSQQLRGTLHSNTKMLHSSHWQFTVDQQKQLQICCHLSN